MLSRRRGGEHLLSPSIYIPSSVVVVVAVAAFAERNQRRFALGAHFLPPWPLEMLMLRTSLPHSRVVVAWGLPCDSFPVSTPVKLKVGKNSGNSRQSIYKRMMNCSYRKTCAGLTSL